MKLLLTGAFQYTEEQISQIKSLGYEIIYVQDERKKLDIDVSDIEAVVCNGLFLYNDIKEFKNLKFIQLTSAGYDRVPMDYIQERGIQIFNAKGVYSVPMAEWVILKILEIYKKSRKFYELQKEHKWEKQRDLQELSGKTAAIIGFGDVGSEVAKRLKAFDVHVIGVGRRIMDSEWLDEYHLINNLDKILPNCDILILTLPLTDETFNLINEERINLMKQNCVLINVARGAIIEKKALLNAIYKFLGVALDVFENEPLENNDILWGLENI